MSNTGTITSQMVGLWEETAFWSFFSNDQKADDTKKCLMERMRKEHRISEIVANQKYVEILVNHLGKERVQEFFRDEFLEKPFLYPPIQCILDDREADSVTTFFRYTADERMARALAELFPDRKVKCDWFIDGMGDYGSFTILNRQVQEDTSGNLQDDFARGDTDWQTPITNDQDASACETGLPF